jgi:small conductance mechanosensitive channel
MPPAQIHRLSPLTARYWTEVALSLWDRVWDLVVLLVVFWVLRSVLQAAVARVFVPLKARSQREGGSRAARVLTLEAITQSVIRYALIFIAGVRLMQIVGFNPAPVLATAGVAGLAVGFGAQRLIRDVITGFFILLEDQFSVGDYVTIGAVTGVVEEIGMRVTRIRDDNGRLSVIANGDIAQVTNYSRGPYRVPVDFAVAPDVDPATLQEAAQSVAARLAKDTTAADSISIKGPIGIDATKATYRIEMAVPPTDRVSGEAALRRALRDELVARGITML